MLSVPQRAGALELTSTDMVPSVTPAGTTINLFDYWQTERDAVDQPNSDAGLGTAVRWNRGINSGHSLHFDWQLRSGTGINHSTGANAQGLGNGPVQGIVQRKLGEDGYPTLSDALDPHSTESLAYLFDPYHEQEGTYRKTYEGVTGLLQIDAQGYYYYNSNSNFAEFDEASNQFNLYNAGAVLQGSTTQKINTYQFFPFVSSSLKTKLFSSRDGNGKLIPNEGLNSADALMNHYFGMSMTTRFVQQADGLVTDANGASQQMTYRFTGDDDAWIFIDGVLVGDVGGSHAPAGVEINFATGAVTVATNLNEDGSFDQIQDTTTIYDMFEAAGAQEDVQWRTEADGSKHTFADNTYHRLNFFYLERGNYDSNLSLMFNLVTAPESQVIKVDQSGEPIASGVGFELYGLKDSTGSALDNTQLEGANWGSPVAKGTTDESGELVLTYAGSEGSGDDKQLVSFDTLYSTKGYTYYKLVETDPPAGYRTAGPIYLQYHPPVLNGGSSGGLFGGYIQAVGDNLWETGASAITGVRTTAPGKIYAAVAGSGTDSQGAELPPDTGTLFALVLKRTGTGLAGNENWSIVTGSALDGWETHAFGTSDADAIRAVADVFNNNNGWIHKFSKSSSGLHEVTIDELPGDVATYYNLIDASGGDKANTQYTVAYYYTTAANAGDATADNTHRLYTGSNQEGEQYKRAFSITLTVPNIKNQLYVQKTDDTWSPLEGNASAAFSLYKEADVVSGSIREGAAPYDTVQTQPQVGSTANPGMVLFTSAAEFPSAGHALEKGTYYLVESSAPAGYEKSAQLIKVVVDDSGVYADAGASDDDVRVRKGVGILVKTMARFASSAQIDDTLHDIMAAPQTLPSGGEPADAGTAWSWNEDASQQEKSLTYGAGKVPLHYGPTGSAPDADIGPDDVLFTADSGWSNVKITQNYQQGDSAHKQQIPTGTTLNSLFTGTTLVQVKNKGYASLAIKKVVEGGAAAETDAFTMRVKLSDKTGDPLSGSFGVRYVDAGGELSGVSTLTFDADGTASVTLHAGQQVIIGTGEAGRRLPAGTTFEIEETGTQAGYLFKSIAPDADGDAIAEGALSALEDPIKDDVLNTSSGVVLVTVTNTKVIGLTIHKIDPGSSDGEVDDSTLEGVRFTLHVDGNEPDSFDAAVDGEAQGLFSDIDKTTPIDTWPISTDGSGNCPVYGLRPGQVYWIVETKTLDGYQKLKDPIKVNVDAAGAITFYGTGVTPEGTDADGMPVITIENRKLPALPQTGGIGNVPLFAVGVVLIAGAACTFERIRTAR